MGNRTGLFSASPGKKKFLKNYQFSMYLFLKVRCEVRQSGSKQCYILIRYKQWMKLGFFFGVFFGGGVGVVSGSYLELSEKINQ